MGIINIPCAPFVFNSSITFQKSASLITEWTELQPGSANGRIVGLFIPGSMPQITSSLSLGAFSNTYLLFFAFLLSGCETKGFQEYFFPAAKFLFLINTASDERIVSISFSSLVKRVLPELTRSQIASARPILGAISTDPLISWMAAVIFFSFRKLERIKG